MNPAWILKLFIIDSISVDFQSKSLTMTLPNQAHDINLMTVFLAVSTTLSVKVEIFRRLKDFNVKVLRLLLISVLIFLSDVVIYLVNLIYLRGWQVLWVYRRA